MKILYSVIILVISGFLPLQAQYSISGKVVSDDTGQPLQGASVYINGSTHGGITNAGGEFSFSSLRNGMYEVVVSFVGYELLIYKAAIENNNVRITFRLVRKPEELRNVVVLTKAGRKKWMEILRENFLGITLPASRCTILNEEEVLFETADEPKALKAFSNVPLVIENKTLGYKVHFELVEFYFNESTGRTHFLGFSRFEELGGSNRALKQYIRNREEVYRGSTMHFFHSLLDSNLESEGYSVAIQPKQEPVVEKKPTQLDTIANPLAFKKTGVKIIMVDEGKKPDSSKANITHTLVGIDSSGLAALQWEGTLQVLYKLAPYGIKYLQQRVMLPGYTKAGARSWLKILIKPAHLYSNGALEDPLSVELGGIWSYERLGNMLPMDYRPGH